MKIFVPIVVILCLLSAACSDSDTSSHKHNAAPVSVAVAERRDVERRLQVVGNVQASATVGVKTRVTGELLAVHFTEGDDIAAGQKLFTIDPRPYEAALREARARLAKDQAQLAKAAEDMRRYAKLVGEGYVSRESYDQAATDAAALRATVQADKAAVESAALQLAYCTITAPMSGRAGAIRADRGNMIKANDTDPILVIDTLEPIYVSFAVPEAHLSAILERHARGRVPVAATPTGGRTAAGELSFIDNSVDTRTGTIKLRGTFENRDRALWPGQFVQVSLSLGTLPGAVVIPARAVQAGRNESYVYVADSGNKAEYRRVRADFEVDGMAVIGEGLQPGEKVVIEGQVRLAPGVLLDIRK